MEFRQQHSSEGCAGFTPASLLCSAKYKNTPPTPDIIKKPLSFRKRLFYPLIFDLKSQKLAPRIMQVAGLHRVCPSASLDKIIFNF